MAVTEERHYREDGSRLPSITTEDYALTREQVLRERLGVWGIKIPIGIASVVTGFAIITGGVLAAGGFAAFTGAPAFIGATLFLGGFYGIAEGVAGVIVNRIKNRVSRRRN